jgi:hypothetical protein
MAVSFPELEARLRTILPEEYQDSYEDVRPVSMGSAGLKYGSDGQVAWDEMWESFCDLAMAGGPPHKGMLLEPGSPAEIELQPERYGEVVREICRGIGLISDLPVEPGPLPGWVRITCPYDAMAGWLVRAIVIENVSAHADGWWLDLPAGPDYRIAKEIKNVVTVIAKTSHYWMGHMRASQQQAIDRLFARLAIQSPLVQPAFFPPTGQSLGAARDELAARIARKTGLPPASTRYTSWLGLECPDVRSAIWMMRGMVASNVLSRREGTSLFVPVDPVTDPGGARTARSLATVHGFAGVRGIL